MGETGHTPVLPNSSGSKRSSRRKTITKNYDENLMDDLIEKHLGTSSRKKNRTQQDLEKETETEAMIALSLGFPIDELLEEEIGAGVVTELNGKEQNNYIVVRNHILARWRANVHSWLSKGQIRETVSNDYAHLINAAYDFLLCNGYINFGISASFESQIFEETTEASVIIVGAGLAGLAAARQLMAFGFKVFVLEGRARPGGRVYTQKMGQNGNYAAVDLGGSVITGIHANPLGVLARQISVPLHKVRDNCPLYKPDGGPVDKEIDTNVEHVFNKLLDKVTQLRQIMSGFAANISLGSVLETLRQLYAVARSNDERQLLDWHFANLEFSNAGGLSNLSAAYWDQDDPYEMGGDHCFLAGGNWRIIRALCKGVPIFYNKTVETIRYGNEGVEVIAGNQVFRADMVLCTVPLGVLKKRAIRFEPELPERKLAAIERLGFGLLNKVAMVFPHNFWGEDLDTFGSLRESSQQRGEFFLFYSYHTVSGAPVLVALVAGDAAQPFENADPASSVHRVLGILRGIYGPQGIHVPDPIQSICTRWGSDPLSYGSYSHIRVQSSGNDYDILAESIEGRLFFGGEATNRQYPATMHGAYLSGLREAARILQATRARQTNPRKSVIQKNLGQSISDVLLNLFKKPDLVFDDFSFVFDPLCGEPKSLGLMRVTLSCYSEDSVNQEVVQLYTVISREQALELQGVNGGSSDKISFLFRNLGLKLMGADALGFSSDALITKLNSSRRGRGRPRFVAG
ncbi:hypothetical protein ABFS82_13G079500 [Erythranthe guttata]|uniref:SWIRM domain-containing protein n=1 Tax=Erythranthe guttata TaxID=4155 RepID=A0A022R3L2_ERYGU|nr:PREDICTED: lysine-specific histone demethylase 1 homolog 2 [Erythranthe guttata]EYU33410.1 hypothetical protein MIMGU_mgv1a027132mg [Erythranthe guttata]|eukprot:XP_012842275.1 PREDICTED: lysine-specific histone demethylase 1 homolog 2 [Erythranthe guttata]